MRAGAPRVGRAAAQQSCLGAFERVECVDLRLRTCHTDAVESGLQAASRASRRRASSPSYVTESTLVGIGAGWLVPMSGAAGEVSRIGVAGGNRATYVADSGARRPEGEERGERGEGGWLRWGGRGWGGVGGGGARLSAPAWSEWFASAPSASAWPAWGVGLSRSPGGCGSRGRVWVFGGSSGVGSRGSRLSSVLSERPVSVRQRLSDGRRECVVCRRDQSCLSTSR